MDLVVLAGGKSRRMGKAKAFLKLGHKSLIEIVIDRLKPLFDKVIISSADGSSFSHLDYTEVSDIYPDCASLGGLHAGLSAAGSSRIFTAACDMPLVNPELVKMLMSRSEHYDVVVPRTAPGMLEPIHAVYAKTCLPCMEELLAAGNLRIFDFYDKVNVDYIEPDEMLPVDPGLHSFFNINTPQDLEHAAKLIAGINGN